MAEIFKFFNSAPGDERWHYASDFADYFADVLSSGLLHKDGTPNLLVKVNLGTMQTVVEPGKALIQGHQYKNTTDLTLTHGLPEQNLDRIDRVVLRLDKRNNARYIRLFVKEGESAVNPVPPSLQRDQYVYELSLAQIRITKNTASLDQLKLVDERMVESLCGIVYSLISVPTTVFQQQWDAYIANQNSKFDDWFESVQAALGDDVAGNLLNMIKDTNVNVAKKYEKPPTGIPKFDLENSVQTTLNKVVDGSTLVKGLVQLTDSVESDSYDTAATPRSVKKAYDSAVSANQGLGRVQGAYGFGEFGDVLDLDNIIGPVVTIFTTNNSVYSTTTPCGPRILAKREINSMYFKLIVNHECDYIQVKDVASGTIVKTQIIKTTDLEIIIDGLVLEKGKYYDFLFSKNTGNKTWNMKLFNNLATRPLPYTSDGLSVTASAFFDGNITTSEVYTALQVKPLRMRDTSIDYIKEIPTRSLQKWMNVKFIKTTPPGSTATIDILDQSGTSTLKSNISSITDISDISTTNKSLKLKISMTRPSLASQSPSLYNMSVTWEGADVLVDEITGVAYKLVVSNGSLVLREV